MERPVERGGVERRRNGRVLQDERKFHIPHAQRESLKGSFRYLLSQAVLEGRIEMQLARYSEHGMHALDARIYVFRIYERGHRLVSDIRHNRDVPLSRFDYMSQKSLLHARILFYRRDGSVEKRFRGIFFRPYVFEVREIRCVHSRIQQCLQTQTIVVPAGSAP